MLRIITLLSLLLVSCHSMADPAKRIIALSPHSVEMLFAIGAGDRIVGTTEYSDYPQAANQIPRIGNYAGIQIERVVELQPDLIVAWRSGNKLADLNKLESLGFNIYYSQPKNIADISDEVIQLGKFAGLEENARQVANNIRAQYAAIKAKYAQQKSIKVFYQMWHDPLRTVGPNSWIDSLIRDCHGTNLFDDAESQYPLVSFESVLVKDPEVIIIPDHSGNIGAKKEIWQKWPQISAMKNNRLFVIDGDYLHRFGPRAVQGLKALCEAIDSARNE